MTTIIDPSGTPTIIFNRGGIAIVSFTAVRQAGSPPTADPIPNVSGHTIAYIAADDNGIGSPWVALPAGADIGDCVEVYLKESATGTELTIVPATGDVIGGGGGSVSAGIGAYFRKVDSTVWRMIKA
ncbi:MAG TPA: hypothetical protein VN843_04355 [Anaerolineales bacterium]|nr:hypothetical protein [Anaerolineales bacterium]